MTNRFRTFLTMLLALTFMITVKPVTTYAETSTGEVIYTEVITPKYEDAKRFSEGLAAVKLGDKWGYINESGEVVIDFQYDYAHSFAEGKALVEKYTRDNGYLVIYYYIITPDNESIQVDYSYFSARIYDSTFYNGHILIPGDTPRGTLVFDEYGQYRYVSTYLPTEGTVTAYYDRYVDLETGEELYGDLGIENIRPFNQGMAPVVLSEKQGDSYDYYYSFLKKDGTFWSGPKFYDYYLRGIYSIHQVFNDHSLASIKNFEGEWGAVNKEGEMIIPFKYEQLGIFTEGVAPFAKNGKFGFVDIDGNEVIKPQYDEASSFRNGLAAVRQGNTAYIIDKQENKIKGSEKIPVAAYFVENENGETIIFHPGEYIVIEENNKFGFGKVAYIENNIKVTDIRLDSTKLELAEGEVATLLATITPIDATNKNLIWTSSDKEVAAVDTYGKVTAKSAGKAMITVTSEDGKHTATSEVIVKETKTDPYAGYRTWSKPLEHQSENHNWTIKLNMHVDENSVDDSSVYIVDNDYNKVGFIHAETENSGIHGSIVLKNNRSFKKGVNYWIIIEDSVRSIDGKKLSKGLKAQFKIN